MPALLAWIGLWWAAYPAEQAFREHTLLVSIDRDLPIHAPPSLWKYVLAQVRQSLLFMLLPVLMILLAHDVMAAVLRLTGFWREEFDQPMELVGAAGVYLFAPCCCAGCSIRVHCRMARCGGGLRRFASGPV